MNTTDRRAALERLLMDAAEIGWCTSADNDGVETDYERDVIALAASPAAAAIIGEPVMPESPGLRWSNDKGFHMPEATEPAGEASGITKVVNILRDRIKHANASYYDAYFPVASVNTLLADHHRLQSAAAGRQRQIKTEILPELMRVRDILIKCREYEIASVILKSIRSLAALTPNATEKSQ